MTGSTDAIAHVQEGIVVDVNPAWSELFGHADPGDLLGQPLMDLFDARSHAALKGALVAAAQGRWSGHALSVMALQPDGGSQPLELELRALRVRRRTGRAPACRHAEARPRVAGQPARAGDAPRFAHRPAASRSVHRIGASARGCSRSRRGLRAVAYLSPDSFGNVELEYGPIVAEEVLDALARRVQEQLQPGDLASRVSPHGIALLVERGNARDQEAWLAKLRERIAAAPLLADEAVRRAHLQHRFGTAAQPWRARCRRRSSTAIAAQRAAAEAGGDRCLHREPAGAKPAIDEADRAWANQIKAALMANRFRLVQQPIANLSAKTGRCSTCWCACSTKPGRKSCRRSSSPRPSAPT